MGWAFAVRQELIPSLRHREPLFAPLRYVLRTPGELHAHLGKKARAATR
jgi:hypothetical protein